MKGIIVAIFILMTLKAVFRRDRYGMTRHQRRKYIKRARKARERAKMKAWEDQYAMFEAMMYD